MSLFDFNRTFNKHFELMRKSKMNFNEMKTLLKHEEISQKFHEFLNFIKNNYIFDSFQHKTSKYMEESSVNNKSQLETPKKGISRTLYKKPTTMLSQFKSSEKKPRKSENFNASNN